MANSAEKDLQNTFKETAVAYTSDRAAAVLIGTAYTLQRKELRLTTKKLSPFVDSATISAKPDGASLGFSWGF